MSCVAAGMPPLTPTAAAAQYSKFEIVVAAKQAGKWDALKAWIDDAGFSDEWLAVEYLIDSDPQFAAITNAVVATGIASAEEVAAILSAAKDTAPDALLGAMYAREMQNAAGRQRWHGRSTTYTDVTNWMSVTVYEDGYRHEEPARHLTPSQQVERANAMLTRTLTRGVSARLAAARLRHLEEASQTNVVTNVVTPDVEPTDLPSEALAEEDLELETPTPSH